MIPLALKAVSVWILCCLLGREGSEEVLLVDCVFSKCQHGAASLTCWVSENLHGIFQCTSTFFFKDLELRKVNKTPKRLPRGLKMTLTLKKIKVKLWIVNLDGSPGNQSSEWGPRDGNIGSYQFGSAWPSTLECRDQVNWINTYVNYKIKTTLI